MLSNTPPSEHWWDTEPKVNACTPNSDAKTSSEEASQRLGLQEARHYDALRALLEHKAKGQCFSAVCSRRQNRNIVHVQLQGTKHKTEVTSRTVAKGHLASSGSTLAVKISVTTCKRICGQGLCP